MILALLVTCILLFIAIIFIIKLDGKLQKINQIVFNRSYTDEIGNAMYYTDEIRVKKIRGIMNE